jgi:peptidoglycan/LPS O-acetylase OafA/YrhL
LSDSAHGSARFAVLDGWRGISILAVLWCHLFPAGPKSWDLNDSLGIFGMALFFCLSGFLITNLLLQDRGVADFLIRRLCRIVPLAWLGLVVGLWMGGAPANYYLPNFLFYANLPPEHLQDLTAHYWSLGVEVQFYAGIALLYGLLGPRGLVLLLPLCVAVTMAKTFIAHNPASITTYYRIDEILAGATLALAYAGRFGGAARSILGRVSPWLLFALLCLSTLEVTGPLDYLRPYFAAALIGRTLIGSATALHAPLRSRPLAYIAAISYALYILHPLITDTWLGTGSRLIKYAKRPLLLAVTFAAAHVSTNYYEARWIALGKRWIERLGVRAIRIPAPDLPAAGS